MSLDMNLSQKLMIGLQSLDLQVAQNTQEKLLQYLEILQKWNRVHNLTAVREPLEMVTLHLLDSLSVLKYVEGKRLLDVGSGAGLPGIPLAICLPDLEVTVMDSSHKKASFMRQAKAELGIDNLQVECGRVEKFNPLNNYDVVISRAFSDIAEFIKLTKHLCADDGKWLAMKGVYPYDEIEQLQNIKDFKINTTNVVRLEVPGLEAQRHLVFLKAA